ncbi:MAG: tetratricopeptide repeat protein [Candidatus Nanopelagicales bacterium]
MTPHPGLAKCEWMVFHGAVNEALPALDELDDLTGRSAVYAVWLRAVALGACGRYGEALDRTETVTIGTPEYSMTRSLKASLLRQLGCHDLALRDDREAMASAATPGAAIEALTGLAADAVGMQDPLTAATMLAQGRSLLARVSADPVSAPTWWRHRVRVEWVACEVALLETRYEDALAHARAALETAEAANAPRHVAKSLLFLAVANIETGRRDAAVPLLKRCLVLSTAMGFLAVAWPAHAVLAALLKDTDERSAHTHFVAASAIIDTLREGLTGQLANRWDARADIVALHREAS